jgi:hypothetical protein
MQLLDILVKYKPGITKRMLLLVAGCLWIFAGSLLLFRGLHFLVPENHHLVLSLLLGIIAGIGFFLLVFYKVSGKYIRRIYRLYPERPCFFSFFSWKSYLVMGCMITLGIILSKLRLFPPHSLHVFFIIMSLPLLFSGLRFLYSSLLFNHHQTRFQDNKVS